MYFGRITPARSFNHLRFLPRETLEYAIEALIAELDTRDGDPDFEAHDEHEPEEDEQGDQSYPEQLNQADLFPLLWQNNSVLSMLARHEDAEDDDSDCCEARDDVGTR